MSNQTEFLAASNFYIEFKLKGDNEEIDAIFQECLGLKLAQETIEICEVTPQKWDIAINEKGVRGKYGRIIRTKIPGNFTTDNLILKRGMTKSATLWKWFESVRLGNWFDRRRDGSVVIYNQAGQEQVRVNIFGAYPVRYTLGDLASHKTDIEIEELELAVDLFTRVL
ncbi:MAG: phage tail protein [Prochloraceae cyanobacterium]